jgi:hypothetical protein
VLRLLIANHEPAATCLSSDRAESKSAGRLFALDIIVLSP